MKFNEFAWDGLTRLLKRALTWTGVQTFTSLVATLAKITRLGVGTTTPTGAAHIVLTVGEPLLIGGDTIATLTGVTISNANPSVLTKDATIDDGLAVGDAVVLNSGTNATVGTYIVASIVVNTSVTLDRQAATGACTDGNITYVNDAIIVEVASGSGKPRIVLPVQDDSNTPTMGFGEAGLGIYALNKTMFGFGISKSNRFRMDYDGFYAPGRAELRSGSMSATSPGFCKEDDTDTGLGSAAADQLSLIAGGVEGLRLTENVGVLQTHQVNVGLTADTGSIQGGTPLTSSYNVIATCANAGDAVTLPAAAAGLKVTIINNGAQSADVFPASGDNLGAGTDTAAALAAGSNITYFAIDTTNWEVI